MGSWSSRVVLSGTRFQDHYTIAVLVFTLISFIGLCWVRVMETKPRYYSGHDSDLREVAFKYLTKSSNLLTVCFFLKLIDIFLKEFQVKIHLGYLFIYAFTDPFFRTFADLIILFVVIKMYQYVFPVQGKKNMFAGFIGLGLEGLWIPILALALFQWSVSIALYVVYLNRTSNAVVNALSTEHEKLVTGFNILYLITATILWGNSLFMTTVRWAGGIPSEEAKFLAITTMLVARSLAVTIPQLLYGIEGQEKPKYEPAVLSAMYGLLSNDLYYLITKQSQVSFSSPVEWEVLRDSLKNAGKDLRRRKWDAAHGGPPYPAAPDLLGELRESPLKYFSKESIRTMAVLEDSIVTKILEKHTRKVQKMR